MDILRIELPYPPSVNHYYIRAKSGVILGAKGRQYRRDVNLLCVKYRGHITADMRISLVVNVYPPDKRKRDLDNLMKAVGDSLQYAGVYPDDNQIDILTIIRRDIVKDGCVKIWVSECS